MGNYLEAHYNGSYTDYNDHNQPNIYDDLLMGSLRFGHSLAQGRLNFGANNSFRLRDHYNRHDVMFLDFEDLIRGLFQQNSQRVDRHVSEDLTNFLNKDSNKNYGEDLVARNIQRGREVGLLPYHRYRKRFLNLDFPTSWNERPGDFSEDMWRRLKEVYRSPLDIDYFTGGLMENRDSNLPLSRTFLWSLHNYFLNVVRADRYFYTHRNQIGSFTQPQLDEINKRTLGSIICDNMPKLDRITQDVFIPLSNINPLIVCGEAPKLNIKIFLD
jgi:peroxidase